MTEIFKEQSINVRRCWNDKCKRSAPVENGNSETRRLLSPCLLYRSLQEPEHVGDLMNLKSENPEVFKALLNNCEFKNELKIALGIKTEELE